MLLGLLSAEAFFCHRETEEKGKRKRAGDDERTFDCCYCLGYPAGAFAEERVLVGHL